MWSLAQSFLTHFSVFFSSDHCLPHPTPNIFIVFFFLIPACHELLMSPIYCVSVYVMWLFGGSQIIAISAIFSHAFPKTNFCPIGGGDSTPIKKAHLVRHGIISTKKSQNLSIENNSEATYPSAKTLTRDYLPCAWTPSDRELNYLTTCILGGLFIRNLFILSLYLACQNSSLTSLSFTLCC